MNAPAATVITLAGISIVVITVESNALLPIVSSVTGRVISSNAVHFANALLPIILTPAGRSLSDLSDEQP